MNSCKVRFNLSAGPRYMKWKIETPDAVSYLDPSEVKIVMHRCTLKNRSKAAKKIYEGAHKVVCSWILCERIEIQQPDELQVNTVDQVYYNPRISPNWIFRGENADSLAFDKLVTSGRNVYSEI
jgi:hypothetical protein